MEETKKRRLYPRDIIFTVISLALMVFSIGSYVAAPTPMGFSNAILQGFVGLCIVGFFIGITAVKSDGDVEINLYITQLVHFAAWWLTILIAYIVVEGIPMLQSAFTVDGRGLETVGLFLGTVFMITMLCLILVAAEFLLLFIISLEVKNKL